MTTSMMTLRRMAIPVSARAGDGSHARQRTHDARELEAAAHLHAGDPEHEEGRLTLRSSLHAPSEEHDRGRCSLRDCEQGPEVRVR